MDINHRKMDGRGRAACVMAAVITPLLVLSLQVAPAVSQLPPRQSESQRSLIAGLQATAAAASDAARPKLLQLLGSQTFRAGLSKCCPSIAQLEPVRLLALLDRQFAAAELTHNFSPVNDDWENDVSVATLSNSSYFYNLWEISFLGIGKPGVQVGGNDVEHTLLGFADFVADGGKAPSSFAEAAARPVYTTVALLNAGLGNPTFGGISAVFSNGYVSNMSLLAPADTGNWESACNTSHAPLPGQCHFPYPLECSAWEGRPSNLGTFESYYVRAALLVLAHARATLPQNLEPYCQLAVFGGATHAAVIFCSTSCSPTMAFLALPRMRAPTVRVDNATRCCAISGGCLARGRACPRSPSATH